VEGGVCRQVEVGWNKRRASNVKKRVKVVQSSVHAEKAQKRRVQCVDEAPIVVERRYAWRQVKAVPLELRQISHGQAVQQEKSPREVAHRFYAAPAKRREKAAHREARERAS